MSPDKTYDITLRRRKAKCIFLPKSVVEEPTSKNSIDFNGKLGNKVFAEDKLGSNSEVGGFWKKTFT